MQVTYFWPMLSCLIFGTAVLCVQMCPNQGSDSLDIKCAHNGNCGKVHTNKEEMSLYGNKKHIEAPWHAIIYRFNKQMSNHDSLCLGSIIAPKLVISVAHCFWQRDQLSDKISVNDGEYKVAVGKYARNFTIVDNKFTKIMNVDFIYFRDSHTPSYMFHTSDINIAIIVLRDKISFSEVVAPVCVDWNGKYKEINGDQGKVVSWGDAGRGTHLLELSLPYIERFTCRNIYTDGFQKFVTYDKFCAGSTTVSGQGLVRGDSGSGLSFLHSNSYFLTGLVGMKNADANDSISIFTEVKYHIQWIRKLYDQHYSTQ